MVVKRWLIGGAVGALVAAGLAVSPAIGSPEANRMVRHDMTDAPVTAIDSFTPAAADPRLAAMFARGGLSSSSFRFTSVEAKRANRAVTVAVRSQTSRSVAAAERSAGSVTPSVGLAPIAYNLGVAVGWRRFAVSGDLARVDMALAPGSREAADVAVSYTAKRFTGRVKAAADRPLEGAPKLIEEAPSYSVDVGGSYKLTRNLDVTAGVRYRADREQRLTQAPDDQRRESQAVYIGTAFRF